MGMGYLQTSMPRAVAKDIGRAMEVMYKPQPYNLQLQLEECCNLELSWNEKLAYLAYKLHDPEKMAEVPLTHRFDKGVYVRTMVLPKEHLFIGRPHKLGHVVRLIEGKAVLIHEKEREIKTAYADMITPPGYTTVAYTLTPVIAQTLHPNPKEMRDITELEDIHFGSLEVMLARGEAIHQKLLLGRS